MYFFMCPECGLPRHKYAGPDVLKLLRYAEVPEVPTIPELEELHTGPALTYDDAIDFHYQLEDPWSVLDPQG